MTRFKQNEFLVCVPTHNEELAIKNVIERLNEYRLDHVIVDGYSTDNTVRLAKLLGSEVIMRSREGKADAFKAAMEFARSHHYSHLAIIDADDSYRVSDLLKLWEKLGSEKMVVGCRPYRNISPGRRLANRIMNLLVWVAYGQSVKDMASGMRIVEITAFRHSFDAVGFNLEPQLCCLSANSKYEVLEIPIDYLPRTGVSKSRPIDVLKACLEIIRMRLNLR